MKLSVCVLLFALLVVSSCTVKVPEQSPALSQEQGVVTSPPVPEELPAPVVTKPEVVVVPEPETMPATEEMISQPEIDVVSYPFLGSENASVTVVEYADFGSGVNSRFHFSQVAALKRDYLQGGKVKLVIKPYPLSSNESKAAEAAFCMWEQGSKQFWSYADVLHRFFSHLEISNLVNYADRVPNGDKFVIKDCLDAGKYSSSVSRSIQSAKAFGVKEVPTLVINGEVLAGDVSYSEIKAAIETKLGEKSGASANLVSITGFVLSVPERLYQIIS